MKLFTVLVLLFSFPAFANCKITVEVDPFYREKFERHQDILTEKGYDVVSLIEAKYSLSLYDSIYVDDGDIRGVWLQIDQIPGRPKFLRIRKVEGGPQFTENVRLRARVKELLSMVPYCKTLSKPGYQSVHFRKN